MIPKVVTSSASKPVPWAFHCERPSIVAVPATCGFKYFSPLIMSTINGLVNPEFVKTSSLLCLVRPSAVEVSIAFNTDLVVTLPTADFSPSATAVLILMGCALPYLAASHVMHPQIQRNA